MPDNTREESNYDKVSRLAQEIGDSLPLATPPQEEKFCKHGSHTYICPECNPAVTDADILKYVTTPQEEKYESEDKYCMRCAKRIHTKKDSDFHNCPDGMQGFFKEYDYSTPPNKQPEAWEEDYEQLISTLMDETSFSEYIRSFHHAKIKDFITKTLTSQRTSDVRRLEGLKKEEKGHWETPESEMYALAQTNGYNTAIDQAIALLTDSK